MRVRQVIAFGKAGPTVESQLRGIVPVSSAPNLAGAVTTAAALAAAGEVVLLAPACASFDEFRDYNDRGDRYRALVEAL